MRAAYELGEKIGRIGHDLVEGLMAHCCNYWPTAECSGANDDEVSGLPGDSLWDWGPGSLVSPFGDTYPILSGNIKILSVGENADPQVIWNNDALRIVQTGYVLPVFHLEKYHGKNLMGGETWVAVDPANGVEAAFVLRELTREFGRYVASDQRAREREGAAVYG